MPVAVIADAHLSGPGGSPEALIAQLETLTPEHCERLVLLGDLFHVWVGIRRFETPDIGSVVAALDRLRRRGVPIDYVEGNRDFFLEGSRYQRLFDNVGTEVTFTSGGKRYLAVHGDRLNDRDYLYRFWRFLSKNRLSRFGTFVLPRLLASGIIHGTERELAKTNFKHKREIPEKVILEYARDRLSQGFAGMILGHFHTPRSWSIAEGEVRIIDAWFHSRRIEWLPEPPH